MKFNVGSYDREQY